MYKPPINSNRVKSIKSKFENIENGSPVKNNVIKNGYRNNLNASSSPKKTELLVSDTSRNEKATLQRQASDPCKRNIKRTPAFRVDKSIERTSEFQRNSYNRSTLFESKVKQFSAVKNNCDNNSNVLVSEKSENINHVPNKPILVKSKSSLDFEFIRSKFDKVLPHNTNINNENQSICDHNLNGVDLSLLYTEPIPKSLRNKNINQSENHEEIDDKSKINDIYSTSTLKLSDKASFEELTDTLKSALKKPLPTGPAPKKPPRTFEHTLLAEPPERNISFLHVAKTVEKKLNIKPKITSKKTDPKYMLSKLENALRNNKLRARRKSRTEISTSGDDSDDSLLFRSKTNEKPNRTLPRLPSQQDNSTSSPFNLNCLNGLSCSIANYEKIKEPNSSFFVSSSEEPIYAEPYHFVKESLDLALRNIEGSTRSRSTTKSARNSLYYMSTPVLSEGSKYPTDMNGFTMSQDEAKLPDLKISDSFHRQPSAENSSLSSFTSDLDSTPSPIEESSKLQSINQCYETKSSMDNSCSHIDSTNRVENLKNCLRKTLDKSFTLDSAIRDSDSENNDENKVSDIIKKFETYRQCMPKYCKPKIHKDSLFYCCLIIEKFRDVAQIKFEYPLCVDIPQNLENLCFPENNSTPQESTDATQNYSLLITNDKGERMFGYCRRVLPEGSTCCLPLAYCILSKYRAPRFYKKILVELESRHGMQDRYRDELISQFYNQKFPKPGDSIKINLANIEPKSSKTENKENFSELYNNVHINRYREYNETYKANNEGLEQILLNNGNTKSPYLSANNMAEKEKAELILTLHPDSRYEDADLKRLHQLPADVLLKIFSSLLLERKVILISSSIGKLSSCVDSLQSILYPFIWHHTFIPILPQQLWDIVESPTPVICGVLSNEVVEYHQIENGIVVDLDNGVVIVEEGDENKILSGSMQKVWRRSIALANRAAASMDYVHSVYLNDAYLQVFIMCFKDYKKYFVDGVFQKEEFLKNAKTKGIRRFLKMFTETYMFLAFLDTVLINPENLVEFDKKIEMYGSEDSNVILDKLLEWHR